MGNQRECGVLLPISSLPSKYGIGCFSKSAYEFVDQLKAAGQGCLADSAPWTNQLRMIHPVPVIFHLCRKSLFYQSGRPDRRGRAYGKRV